MDKIYKNTPQMHAWWSQYQPAACLRVSGEDSFSFLQGQFTQDLRSLAPNMAAYGLWLNQKGKVLADSFVLKESDNVFWVMSISCSAQVIQERLEAYIIADDVVIDNRTSEWRGLVVGGGDAESWLKNEIGEVPAAGEFIRGHGGFVFRGRRDGGVSFEWVLPREAMPPAGMDNLLGADELDRLRIEAGLPRVPQDIGIADLPQEGGLDAVGISYTKGCYLGQEVMARLKAMGTVRRRLVRVRAAGRINQAVPVALLQGEKRVGELRSVAPDGVGGFIGLAMISKQGLDPHVPLAPEPGGAGYIEIAEVP